MDHTLFHKWIIKLIIIYLMGGLYTCGSFSMVNCVVYLWVLLSDHSKVCYRSVSGCHRSGSNRWSGSPVPVLASEVAIWLLGTGHRLEPDIPVEMSSQRVIVHWVSLSVWQLFIVMSRNSTRTTVLKLWQKDFEKEKKSMDFGKIYRGIFHHDSGREEG